MGFVEGWAYQREANIFIVVPFSYGRSIYSQSGSTTQGAATFVSILGPSEAKPSKPGLKVLEQAFEALGLGFSGRGCGVWISSIVNPGKLEHEFRMISARIRST